MDGYGSKNYSLKYLYIPKHSWFTSVKKGKEDVFVKREVKTKRGKKSTSMDDVFKELNSWEFSTSIPGSLSFAFLPWSKGDRVWDRGWGVIQKKTTEKASSGSKL